MMDKFKLLDQALDQQNCQAFQGPCEIQTFNCLTHQLSKVWALREGWSCPRISGNVRHYPSGIDATRIIREVDPTYGTIGDYLWVRDLWCFKIVDGHTYSYDPERHKIVNAWLDGKELMSSERSPLGLDLTTELGQAYRKLIDVLDVAYPCPPPKKEEVVHVKLYAKMTEPLEVVIQ